MAVGIGIVERLQQEMREIPCRDGVEIMPRQRLPRLRPDQLQLVASALHHLATRLGTDAHPVDARMHRQGAVALDRNLEARAVQRLDQRIIDLQHRLAAGEDDIALLPPFAPEALRHRGKLPRGCIFRAVFAIGADEIRIAEPADRLFPILLPPRPEVAPGKAQKNSAAARSHALALQGQEQLLDRIAHA